MRFRALCVCVCVCVCMCVLKGVGFCDLTKSLSVKFQQNWLLDNTWKPYNSDIQTHSEVISAGELAVTGIRP